MKSNTRSPRQTAVETGRLVKVTLGYGHILHDSYLILKIVNEIAVPVNSVSRHVGDYLTEAEATELLTEPGIEITTIPAK